MPPTECVRGAAREKQKMACKKGRGSPLCKHAMRCRTPARGECRRPCRFIRVHYTPDAAARQAFLRKSAPTAGAPAPKRGKALCAGGRAKRGGGAGASWVRPLSAEAGRPAPRRASGVWHKSFSCFFAKQGVPRTVCAPREEKRVFLAKPLYKSRAKGYDIRKTKMSAGPQTRALWPASFFICRAPALREKRGKERGKRGKACVPF